VNPAAPFDLVVTDLALSGETYGEVRGETVYVEPMPVGVIGAASSAGAAQRVPAMARVRLPVAG